MFLKILTRIDDVMYYPVLIIIMAIAGLYFTIRTRGVQIRLFGEACRLILEKPVAIEPGETYLTAQVEGDSLFVYYQLTRGTAIRVRIWI